MYLSVSRCATPSQIRVTLLLSSCLLLSSKIPSGGSTSLTGAHGSVLASCSSTCPTMPLRSNAPPRRRCGCRGASSLQRWQEEAKEEACQEVRRGGHRTIGRCC